MQTHNILALDVGEKRVGVARAHAVARLPAPLMTLSRGDDFWHRLQKVIQDEDIQQVVIGLPRNLDSEPTAQTRATERFIAEFKHRFDIAVATQDEALTSRKAEAELRAQGKPYAKGDVDALAATYILEDYLKLQEIPL